MSRTPMARVNGAPNNGACSSQRPIHQGMSPAARQGATTKNSPEPKMALVLRMQRPTVSPLASEMGSAPGPAACAASSGAARAPRPMSGAICGMQTHPRRPSACARRERPPQRRIGCNDQLPLAPIVPLADIPGNVASSEKASCGRSQRGSPHHGGDTSYAATLASSPPYIRFAFLETGRTGSSICGASQEQ